MRCVDHSGAKYLILLGLLLKLAASRFLLLLDSRKVEQRVDKAGGVGHLRVRLQIVLVDFHSSGGDGDKNNDGDVLRVGV